LHGAKVCPKPAIKHEVMRKICVSDPAEGFAKLAGSAAVLCLLQQQQLLRSCRHEG
jgi:hypothetical protein